MPPEQLALPDASCPDARIGVGADLDLVTHGSTRAWATFSPCYRYRYALARFWDEYYSEDRWELSTRPLMVARLLNPSTATHEETDPTLSKMIGFAKREGCGGLLIVNTAALRSTDPRELVRAWKRGEDIVGEHTTEVVRRVLSLPVLARVVVGWGRPPSARLRWLTDRAWVEVASFRRGARCFGVNADGTPKHPLYLAKNTPLIPYEAFRG